MLLEGMASWKLTRTHIQSQVRAHTHMRRQPFGMSNVKQRALTSRRDTAKLVSCRGVLFGMRMLRKGKQARNKVSVLAAHGHAQVLLAHTFAQQHAHKASGLHTEQLMISKQAPTCQSHGSPAGE
eukprot:1158772-Pelagomonas_calceolata.AAC.5